MAVTAAYYLQGVKLVRRTKPALVHANDYNTMWIGVAAKLLHGSHLVYDSHELWPDRNGRPEWRPWLLACEALFVRVADQVMTTSPGYASAIARRYRVRQPVVVRNIPAATAPTAAAATTRGSDPTVVYVGGLMPGRGLEQAIGALAIADRVRLRLIGPGNEPYRRSLLTAAERAGVAPRVEIVAPVAPTAVVDLIRDADMGLMMIQPICRSYELTLPNKLFEYAAAELPVLASDLPVIGPLVRAEGIGVVVAPDSSRLLAAAMKQLSEPAFNAQVRERVRAFARGATWDAERAMLERVYRAGLRTADSVPETYRRYRESPAKQRSWRADNPGNAAIRAELTEAVFDLAGPQLRGARRILDLGCGSGWWLARLAGEPSIRGSLSGIELLSDRVSAARRRVPQAAIEHGDAHRLPYGDRHFDVVTMLTVLSSLRDKHDAEMVLLEAERVLAPGGTVLIWEPRLPNPTNRRTFVIDPELPARVFAGSPVQSRTTTLIPPLARHLGPFTNRLYPQLARFAPLRSHRLIRVGPTPPS